MIAPLSLDFPTGISLDLHGNIFAETAELADLVIGCKHYPLQDAQWEPEQ